MSEGRDVRPEERREEDTGERTDRFYFLNMFSYTINFLFSTGKYHKYDQE